jgi:hypothetical protein
MRWPLLACILAACGFRKGAIATDDGSVIGDDDAPGMDAMGIDVMPDAPAFCYGSGLVETCFDDAPSGTVTLDNDIDTDTDGLCDDDPRNAAWCVIAAGSITVNDIAVTGALPLVLVSTSTIDVDGMLDASSKVDGSQIGAGATSDGCLPGTLPSDANAGGAGGSFGGLGGDGSKTGHGTAGAALTPTTLRGGCPGQRGGGGPGVGGAGGPGGGAVYLIADTITVDGTINASGAGGQAGQSAQAGGGGAGAGGMIGFDAMTVTVTGTVLANGGGGGEGGRGGGGAAQDGTDPNPTMPLVRAPGGSDSTTGCDGGDGAAGTMLDGINGEQPNSMTTAGGGGGGGGGGIIKLYRAGAITGANVSPLPPS